MQLSAETVHGGNVHFPRALPITLQGIVAKDTTLLHGRAWPRSECEEHIAHTMKLGIMSLIKSAGDAIFPATPLLSTPHLPIALSWSSKHL